MDEVRAVVEGIGVHRSARSREDLIYSFGQMTGPPSGPTD
jgi:hypothetical protein